MHAGLRVVDPALATESLAGGANPLTPREQEVLRVALSRRHGGRDRRGGAPLAGTVRNHLSAAIGKTGTTTRAEAARVAQDRGWL